MTVNEIIKAWEKVLAMGDAPIGEHWDCSVTTKLAKDTFNTLNRQKAEIKKLEKVEHFATKTIEKQQAEIERLNIKIKTLKAVINYNERQSSQPRKAVKLMRDRLIELMQEWGNNCTDSFPFESVADYLLANGVIVPPLKIGQELWDIHYNKPRKWEVVYLGYNGKEWHINIHWWKDRHNFKTLSITYPFVEKMWYLSKEEAEQELGGAQG